MYLLFKAFTSNLNLSALPKINMKFYFTSRNPMLSFRTITIWFFDVTFLTDSASIMGVAANPHYVSEHSQLFSTVQMLEHPSPFKVLPSSQISYILKPSPQISSHSPSINWYPSTLLHLMHSDSIVGLLGFVYEVTCWIIYPDRQDIGSDELHYRLFGYVSPQS